MDYTVFIQADAAEFLEFIVSREGTRLFYVIKQLGKNPFRDPDFVDHGFHGGLNGILIDQYAVLYQVDHATK